MPIKHLVILVVALFCTVNTFGQVSQYNADSFLLYKNGKYFVNGEQVKGEDLRAIIGNNFYDTSYHSGTKLRNAGVVCTWVGAGVTAAGITGMVVSSIQMSNESNPDAAGGVYAVSVIGMISGVLCLIPGIVLNTIGNKKLNNIAVKHNAGAHSAILSIEPTSNGMGLCMKF